MAAPIRIWLVEDEPYYRTSFEALVATTEGFVVERSFEQYEDLEEAMQESIPDLVVLDLGLPGVGGMNGLRRLRRRTTDACVVVLTLQDEAEHIVEALRAGASGYVVKGTRPDGMFRSMREAVEGGTYFSPDVARHVLGYFDTLDTGAEALSERELEVLRELARGRSKKGIAEELYLSPHTIDTHLRAVYRKLHVRTATEAVAKGIRSGLIS